MTEQQPPYVERWECEVPANGVSYQVLEDHWDHAANPMVRTIKRISIAEQGTEQEPTPAEDRAWQAMNGRWKVACINWGFPHAPHAASYFWDGETIRAERYWPTWPEAIAHVGAAGLGLAISYVDEEIGR